MITRRQAIKQTALGTVVAASAIQFIKAQPAPGAASAPTGPFKLPPLPYAFDALEPHIDARTMEIHHDKHHAAYVTNLNKAVADQPDLAKKSVEELLKSLSTVPENIRTAVRNQGGGHYNHSLFWQMLKKNASGKPSGELATAIDKTFRSFDGFKETFTKTATGLFGSGWVWLVKDADGVVTITSAPNQDTPIAASEMSDAMRRRYGLTPAAAGAKTLLLGIDLWEHAYYLKYQNRRPEYIAAFFNVINWDFVSSRYQA